MPVDSERSRSLIRKLDQLLAKTHAKPLPERVHQIRTTARRLEALLQTLYPRQSKPHNKLRKRLRRLRRGAGGVRDVDVQIVALRKLSIGRETERKTRLMQALNDLRSLREQKLCDELRDRRARKLRKALRRWGAELAPLLRSSTASKPGTETGATLSVADAVEAPAIAAVVAPQPPIPVDPWEKLDPVSMALRRFARLSRQATSLTPENLHAFRTGCKRVRYLAEMAGNNPEAKHIVDRLKRIQDVVGDWHDWLTLTETAESQFARSLDSALIAALRNVTNAKFVEARMTALEARRALMAEYRAMLARQRAERTSRPGGDGGGKRAVRQRRSKTPARVTAPPRRTPKAVAAAQQSGVA